jgi:hypothetical protein
MLSILRLFFPIGAQNALRFGRRAGLAPDGLKSGDRKGGEK